MFFFLLCGQLDPKCPSYHSLWSFLRSSHGGHSTSLWATVREHLVFLLVISRDSVLQVFFFFFHVQLFLKIFIYFNWRLITLQYCSGFCHTMTRISHGCKCGPHLEPRSHLSPHPIPQGHPGAPAVSTLSHASNLDW